MSAVFNAQKGTAPVGNTPNEPDKSVRPKEPSAWMTRTNSLTQAEEHSGARKEAFGQTDEKDCTIPEVFKCKDTQERDTNHERSEV